MPGAAPKTLQRSTGAVGRSLAATRRLASPRGLQRSKGHASHARSQRCPELSDSCESHRGSAVNPRGFSPEKRATRGRRGPVAQGWAAWGEHGASGRLCPGPRPSPPTLLPFTECLGKRGVPRSVLQCFYHSFTNIFFWGRREPCIPETPAPWGEDEQPSVPSCPCTHAPQPVGQFACPKPHNT